MRPNWIALVLGCALASTASAQYLDTTLARGNGHNGAMFDISAGQDLVVKCFEVSTFSPGAPNGEIEVWFTPNPHGPVAGTPVAWTRIGAGKLAGSGPGILDRLPVAVDVCIPSGATYGFYVTSNDPSDTLAYSNGTGVVYGNADMKIPEGLGVAYPFGTTFSPRMLNMRVRYVKGSRKALAIDTGLDELYSVDLATGAAVFEASVTGVSTAADLTYRPDQGTLWAIDLSGGELGPIDTTGQFTPVHLTGMSGWQGNDYDPVSRKWLLANQDDDNYEYDPETGMLTLLANSGFGMIACLDGSPASAGTAMGIDFSTGDLVRVDRATGTTGSFATTIPGFQGLGISRCDGTWYATNTNDDSLYTIDPSTGTETLVGPHGLTIGFVKGFDLVESNNQNVYCRAKTNSLGCDPAIASWGRPSASALAGFRVTCELVRNNKAGLMFYSLAGRASIPFQGGTLCVSIPIRRTPAQFAGGTALGTDDCTGHYELDMNAFANGAAGGNPAPGLLVPGNTVNCQWWGRDQGFPAPFNTMLSNALEYVQLP